MKKEDYNVITPDNKIWDFRKWMHKTEINEDISDNPYPVMYVEGKPVWEGMTLLFMQHRINKQMLRKVFWQHRALSREEGQPNGWIDNWSFKIKEHGNDI